MAQNLENMSNAEKVNILTDFGYGLREISYRTETSVSQLSNISAGRRTGNSILGNKLNKMILQEVSSKLPAIDVKIEKDREIIARETALVAVLGLFLVLLLIALLLKNLS